MGTPEANQAASLLLDAPPRRPAYDGLPTPCHDRLQVETGTLAIHGRFSVVVILTICKRQGADSLSMLDCPASRQRAILRNVDRVVDFRCDIANYLCK
jgi:hypothetical protein